MSLNTSHTPDGRGVLLYSGEVILIYSKEVLMQFDGLDPVFEGRKNGPLFLTSHRVIFMNNDGGDGLLSFSIPFQALRDVKVRHPEIGATYLKGQVLAQPNGNWIGDAMFKLTFYTACCIEFGEALMKAAKLAQHHHAVYAAPPAYDPPPGNYFSAPPASYIGQDYGLNIPTNAFPDHPAAGTVYMYEAPPPYAGIPPPIHLLPNELLVKIIDKLPRTQWPALDLVDYKFWDAVLLAWGSVREVDMDRDFIYSESKAIEDERRLLRQIAQKTEAILKKLSERSPLITSLSGLSFIVEDQRLNTTAIQYLARFEHLEMIKIVRKYLSGRIVNGREIPLMCDIPLINFVEFIESTRSRAALKEIDIKYCSFPKDPIIVANFDERLRAAVANDPNDPTRQLLQLESLSMRLGRGNFPLTFVDTIDASKLTELSFGDTAIDPTVLTNLIKGAPRLQHIDFAFLRSCKYYDDAAVCPGGRLQSNKDLLAALESHPNLTSLGFHSIWHGSGCACHRFEAEFKTMLRTIAPQLVNFAFDPGFPFVVRMGEIRYIIRNHMPQLKSITLGDRCAANPEELRGIADLKELEEIEIAAYAYAYDHVSYKANLNGVLSSIINKAPGLKKFNGGARFYPDQRTATELCKLSDLIDLRIDADQLTKENFVAFSQVFAEKVEILHLGSIGRGVESGLIELVKKATRLRELEVERNVTDRLLKCLAESCPNLEKFYASGVDGITFDGLQMLVDRCPKLRWLYVQYTDRTLKNLKVAPYRKLEFI